MNHVKFCLLILSLPLLIIAEDCPPTAGINSNPAAIKEALEFTNYLDDYYKHSVCTGNTKASDFKYQSDLINKNKNKYWKNISVPAIVAEYMIPKEKENKSIKLCIPSLNQLASYSDWANFIRKELDYFKSRPDLPAFGEERFRMYALRDIIQKYIYETSINQNDGAPIKYLQNALYPFYKDLNSGDKNYSKLYQPVDVLRFGLESGDIKAFDKGKELIKHYLSNPNSKPFEAWDPAFGISNFYTNGNQKLEKEKQELLKMLSDSKNFQKSAKDLLKNNLTFNKVFSKQYVKIEDVLCEDLLKLLKDPSAKPMNNAKIEPPTGVKEDGTFFVTSDQEHTTRIISDPSAALEIRLQMIERATKSIDLETFIYQNDTTGKIFMNALIEKKKKNPDIKIKVLIDRLASDEYHKIDENYAAELRKLGIEVKVYNPTFPLDVTQQRDHRKFLIVDGKEVVTGSRNIEDLYFGLGRQFNFKDRDIWIDGQISQAIKKSFDVYWNSNLSVSEQQKGKPSSKKQDEIRDFLTMNKEDETKLNRIRNLGKEALEDTVPIKTKNVTFASDKPYNEKGDRIVNQVFKDRLSKAKNGVFMDMAYFLPLKDQLEIFDSLKKNNVKVSVMTPGFGSYIVTESMFGYIMNKRLDKSIERGVKVFGFKPDVNLDDFPSFRIESPSKDDMERAYSGSHSKSVVFDNNIAWIGSMNDDARSIIYNNEAVLIFNDPEIARMLTIDQLKKLPDTKVYDEFKHTPDTNIFQGIIYNLGEIIIPSEML